MSSRVRAASKRAGENAEAAVIQTVPELESVPDADDVHVDARVAELLSPSTELPFVGMCVLEVGILVEIKSVMAVYGEAQTRGRFYLRRGQHEHLLAEGGVYLFAVCKPRPKRPLIAMKVVPATAVDELVCSWIDGGDGRPNYAQIRWSRVFDVATVEGADRR
ncbi:hypothetical protein [Haloprofundus sp. MHR1]|uniref:hypothetical protein n=1 Tax=Haloprofundus sp. MHR1 TaxID=2572921 RepID=UPI0010BF62DE|nr:hypothetical protein [Haloprofundus sp. MHR1]QCJ47258.1 hypothetical protein FCF25_09075 [Haloprofundus sp. MHR1]